MGGSTDGGSCRRRCRSTMGLLLAFASAIFAAVMTLLVKFLREAGADHLLLVRWVVQYIFTLPVLAWRFEPFVPGEKKMNVFVLGTCIICVFASVGLFFSITFLPVGDAVAVMSTYVVFVGFFACIFLKDVIFALLALVGSIIVARPPFLFGSDQSDVDGTTTDRLIGVLLAVLGSVCAAVAMVAVRRMGERVHYSLIVFYYAVCGMVINSTTVLVTQRVTLPCLEDLLVMLLSAFAAILNNVLLVLALQNEAAAPVTIVCTSEVVFAFLFEFLFLGTVPSTYSVIGATLIMVSCIGLPLLSIRSASESNST